MKCLRFRNEDLRHQEWFEFYSEFKAITEKHTAVQLDIESQFSHFVSLYAQAAEAIRYMRTSYKTKQLAKLHHLRGKTYSGLKSSVAAFCNHYDPQICKSALRMKRVFDHYQNLSRKPYNEASASYEQFIQNITGDYSPELTSMLLTDWVDKLQEQNRAFVQLMDERHDERALVSPLRMKDVRKKMDKSYRRILDRLDAIVLLEGESKHKEYIDALNVRIAYCKNQLALAEGRRVSEQNQKQ